MSACSSTDHECTTSRWQELLWASVLLFLFLLLFLDSWSARFVKSLMAFFLDSPEGKFHAYRGHNGRRTQIMEKRTLSFKRCRLLAPSLALTFQFLNLSIFAAQPGIQSPDGTIELKLLADQGPLQITVSFKNKTILEPSPLRLSLDGL